MLPMVRPRQAGRTMLVEDALGGPGGRGAGLAVGVELEEGGDRRLDLVPTPLRFGRYSRYRRNSVPSLEPMAMGRSCGARGSEREPALAGAGRWSVFLLVDAVVGGSGTPS